MLKNYYYYTSAKNKSKRFPRFTKTIMQSTFKQIINQTAQVHTVAELQERVFYHKTQIKALKKEINRRQQTVAKEVVNVPKSAIELVNRLVLPLVVNSKLTSDKKKVINAVKIAVQKLVPSVVPAEKTQNKREVQHGELPENLKSAELLSSAQSEAKRASTECELQNLHSRTSTDVSISEDSDPTDSRDCEASDTVDEWDYLNYKARARVWLNRNFEDIQLNILDKMWAKVDNPKVVKYNFKGTPTSIPIRHKGQFQAQSQVKCSNFLRLHGTLIIKWNKGPNGFRKDILEEFPDLGESGESAAELSNDILAPLEPLEPLLDCGHQESTLHEVVYPKEELSVRIPTQEELEKQMRYDRDFPPLPVGSALKKSAITSVDRKRHRRS